MKIIIILIFVLSTILCGCENEHETIEIYSKDETVFDNININLKSGYWVKDYNIDYENNVIILNLYEEELGN